MRAQHWSARVLATVAAATTVASGAVVVAAGPAIAGTVTARYDSTGSYDWTVPQGVSRLHVDALGGSGASYHGYYLGGAGAHVTADISVTPGETLHLHVAGNGSGDGNPAGGSNGGGNGVEWSGGGGGATDVRIGGDDLTDRVLVAAGGGGFSGFDTPGDAGQPGGPSQGCSWQIPAQPGTQISGGAAGTPCDGTAGTNGSLGHGGDGGFRYSGNDFGGGGGAGYYGGGGGGPYGGGAGGSNLIPSDATGVSQTLGSRGAQPYLHLSYATPPARTVTVATTAASLPADGTSTTGVTATVTDQYGQAVPADQIAFSSSAPGATFGPVTDNADGTYSAQLTSGTTSGTATVTATDTSGQNPVDGETILEITALSQTVTFDSVAPSPVVGETYSPAAHGGGSHNAVSFSIGAASTSACSIAHGTVTFHHAGSCAIDADQTGDAQYAAASTVRQVVAVAPAATTTTIVVRPHALTARVVPLAPGAGTPTGIVAFKVDGVPFGTASLTDGAATLEKSVPADAPHGISAAYAGSADYTGSSASTTTHRAPTVRAHVSSMGRKSRFGWYRTPVTVSFTCATYGAELTTACPAPVTLSRSLAGQSVTRTVTATDGGVGTAVVSGINIDRIAPRPSISGVRNGATYPGAAPKARCVSRDSVSGPASCALTTTHSGDMFRYMVTTTDLAGNTATVRGSYHVLSSYVRGVRRSHGAFVVRAGRTYTLVVTTHGRSAPRYYNAAVSGRRPGPAGPLMHAAGRSHGRYVWTQPVFIDRGMPAHVSWVLGAKADGSLRLVPIRVRR